MDLSNIFIQKKQKHFQEMIAEEDPDGDGIVTKEEFTKMLERKKWSASYISLSTIYRIVLNE